ncbi:MBA1 Inner membrane mitoribosome receptor MBA1 [Candida maltosa Xu316]
MNSSSTTNKNTPATPKKKKGTPEMNMANVPISYFGVMSDFYVPPKITTAPIKYWPKLLLKRVMVFASNTYNIVKFKRELGVPLRFNEWKDRAIEHYVRTNKVFAQACNEPSPVLKGNIISKKLDHVCGYHTMDVLKVRSATFPSGSVLSWELLKIENNPKVVMFNIIPDNDGVALYVQFIMKLKTRQKIAVTKDDKVVQEKESSVEDYLVYTLNPTNQELILAGKLFESNYERGLKPEMDITDANLMQKFLSIAADIHRDDPRKLK